MKVKMNDNVLVIAGKYRGKKGRVTRVFKKRDQVVVEKINIRVKHIKKRPGQAGQKIQFEAPFSASNVIVLCPQCEKPTRVSHIFLKTGQKQRVCKKCGQSLDKPIERKKTKKR